MTEQEANERCALLLGYAREDDYWLKRSTGGPDWYRPYAPDFSQWDRFPELQRYIRGLDLGVQQKIGMAIKEELIPQWGSNMDTLFDVLLGISPEVLRDITVAVVGEEAEVGS